MSLGVVDLIELLLFVILPIGFQFAQSFELKFPTQSTKIENKDDEAKMMKKTLTEHL